MEFGELERPPAGTFLMPFSRYIHTFLSTNSVIFRVKVVRRWHFL
jgi:hypothetical protein